MLPGTCFLVTCALNLRQVRQSARPLGWACCWHVHCELGFGSDQPGLAVGNARQAPFGNAGASVPRLANGPGKSTPGGAGPLRYRGTCASWAGVALVACWCPVVATAPCGSLYATAGDLHDPPGPPCPVTTGMAIRIRGHVHGPGCGWALVDPWHFQCRYIHDAGPVRQLRTRTGLAAGP